MKPEKRYWIKTGNNYYVEALHGTCYISWVEEHEKANAQTFSGKNVHEWITVLSEFTERALDIEEVK